MRFPIDSFRGLGREAHDDMAMAIGLYAAFDAGDFGIVNKTPTAEG